MIIEDSYKGYTFSYTPELAKDMWDVHRLVALREIKEAIDLLEYGVTEQIIHCSGYPEDTYGLLKITKVLPNNEISLWFTKFETSK